MDILTNIILARKGSETMESSIPTNHLVRLYVAYGTQWEAPFYVVFSMNHIYSDSGFFVSNPVCSTTMYVPVCGHII